jgi:hypothetical protein
MPSPGQKQRNEKIVQPRGQPIAGYSATAERTEQTGGKDNREICDDRRVLAIGRSSRAVRSMRKFNVSVCWSSRSILRATVTSNTLVTCE